MNFSEFYELCVPLTESRIRQKRNYFDDHAVRFYRTYLACARCLQPGKRVLSVGAGAAYVESVLVSQLQCSVTIFDFPGMITAQEKFYQSQGFRAVGMDIARYQATDDAEPFDLVLSSEIVEHIPEAPSRHIGRFRSHLKTGGALVITTPNFGSFRNLVRFALQRAVLEKPELSFLPSTFENEQYHRREYMTCEIRAALESCALRPERLDFSMNSANRSTKDLVFMPFEKLVPRWKMTQIATARAT